MTSLGLIVGELNDKKRPFPEVKGFLSFKKKPSPFPEAVAGQ
jgi:hypothetical protein